MNQYFLRFCLIPNVLTFNSLHDFLTIIKSIYKSISSLIWRTIEIDFFQPTNWIIVRCKKCGELNLLEPGVGIAAGSPVGKETEVCFGAMGSL